MLISQHFDLGYTAVDVRLHMFFLLYQPSSTLKISVAKDQKSNADIYIRINKEKHGKNKIKQLGSKIALVLQKGIVYFGEVTWWFPNGALLKDVGVGLDF